MRIWLEKCIDLYYIHTSEPDHQDNNDGVGWFTEDGDNVGTEICIEGLEAILPRAAKMKDGELAEIELVNCGMWTRRENSNDSDGELYDDDFVYTAKSTSS